MASPRIDVLIIGCGYLGRRAAAQWIAAGRKVAALTRRNADALAALGITPITGDVLDPASLRNIPAASTVLYAVARDRDAEQTMRELYINGLGHVLDTLPPPQRFLYVSSTSVYGQTNGEWVDEAAPTEPAEDSGRVVLDAERLLRAKLPAAIVLRLSGIYGPDRLLRKRSLILQGEPLTGDADRWLNLIHGDDGAAAVRAAEVHAAPGSTYNITDNEPTTRRAFYTRLAELLNALPARFDSHPEPKIANRRVSNRTARERLHWVPRFPTYREGLANAI